MAIKVNRQYKLRPKQPLYIACQEMDFSWYAEEVQTVQTAWETGSSIYEIAGLVQRDPDEVLILLIDLARKGRIKARKKGLLGDRRR